MTAMLETLSQSWCTQVLRGILPAAALAVTVLLLERTRWRPSARWRMVLWGLVLLRPFWPHVVGIPGGIGPTWPAPWSGAVGSREPAAARVAAPEFAAAGAEGVPRSADAIAPGGPAESPAGAPEAHAAPPGRSPGRTAPVSWPSVVFLAWASAVVAWWLTRCLRSQRFRKRLALRRPSPAILERLRRQVTEAGLPPAALDRLRLSARTSSPLVLGALRPVIVIPEALVGSESIRPIIVHELVHLRWRDPLLLALADLVRAAHVLNPALWIAARRLRDLAEQACDEESCRRIGDAHIYAEALVDVSSRITRGSPSLAFAERLGRSRLARRIGRILAARRAGFGWRGPLWAVAWIALAAFSLPGAAASKAPARGSDRPVRLEITGRAVIEADAIDMDVDGGTCRLRADPDRTIEARILIPRGGEDPASSIGLQAKEARLQRGPEGQCSLRIEGPIRIRGENPSLAATAGGAVADLSPEGAISIRAEKADVRFGTSLSARAERVMLRWTCALDGGPARDADRYEILLEGEVEIHAREHSLRCDRAVLHGDETLRCAGVRAFSPGEILYEQDGAASDRTGRSARLPRVRRIVAESFEITLDPPDGEGEDR